MLLMRAELAPWRARNQKRRTLLSGQSWALNGKLRSMLSRQQSATPRGIYYTLFQLRTLDIHNACPCAMRARAVEAGTCNGKSQLMGSGVRTSQPGVEITVFCLFAWLFFTWIPSTAWGCVFVAAARTLILHWVFGCGAACVSDALRLRRRRGGGSLGGLRRRFARGSRWKFQFALQSRVRPSRRIRGLYAPACRKGKSIALR